MTRILDYNGRDAERTVTVADIRALKGSGRRFVQVTAGTAEEAAAAEAAGIDMVVCLAQAVPDVRRGSGRAASTRACSTLSVSASRGRSTRYSSMSGESRSKSRSMLFCA